MSARLIGRWARLGSVAAACIAALFLHAHAALAAAEWIVDLERGCGTTSYFADADESIRWFGGCRDGKLDGPGILVWYQGGIETERYEGTFRVGELDGEAVIRLANGVSIFGAYRAGVRHGDFVIVRADGRRHHPQRPRVRGNLDREQGRRVASGAGPLPRGPPPSRR